MTIPRIISYYTPDPIYTLAAERLKASLDKFGLRHTIIACEPRGNWNANTCYKSSVIYANLYSDLLFDQIWLDADAEVMLYPELLSDLDCDIAAVVNDKGLLASMIYFRNCPEVRELVADWVKLNKENPGERTGDQINLERLLKKNDHQLRFQALPWEYSYIPDIMGYIENPVILQHQASRQGRGYYP
jgi:hypothetical protein